MRLSKPSWTSTVNAPSTKADGFSGKLRGIPHALRLKAGSRPRSGRMQHDTSRGDISVENASAVAAVLPLTERLGCDRAAFLAGLGRPSWVDQPDVDTGAFSLVSDMLDELRSRGVVYGLGEHPAGQAEDIQVLHRDGREAIYEPPGQLVRKVPALIGDARMQPRYRTLCLALPFAVPPSAGYRSLEPAQPLCPFGDILRRGHHLACGQGHDAGQPHVDADRREGSINRLGVWQFDLETDEPLRAGSADHSGAELGISRQRPVPLHFDLGGDADDPDALAVAHRQAVCDPKLGAIEPAFGAKSREASLGFGLEAAEERGERLVEPTQYLLCGGIAIPGKPVIGEPHSLQFLRLIDVTKALALPLIRLNALLQAGVVELAERAKHAVQRHGLRSGRIEAALIGPQHSTALLRFAIACDRVLRDSANRGREVAAAPKCWQSRPQRPELLPQNAAGSSFQSIDDLGDTKRRVGFNDSTNR